MPRRITATAFFVAAHRYVPPPAEPLAGDTAMAHCGDCHPGVERGDYASGPGAGK